MLGKRGGGGGGGGRQQVALAERDEGAICRSHVSTSADQGTRQQPLPPTGFHGKLSKSDQDVEECSIQAVHSR